MAKAAFLFPGQGSQKVGMGQDLAARFAEARQVYERADAQLGFALSRLCFEGPDEALRQTDAAQPALFVTSIAALRAFEATCPTTPAAVAGHSVGEYAALVAAGALTFEDGLGLVYTRGKLMREAAEARPGAMAAVLGLDPDAVRQLCDEIRKSGVGVVSVANLNGAGQSVISGETAAVEAAAEMAKTRGAKRVKMLPVTGGFHSPLMVTAGDALFSHLSRIGFRKPRVRIVSNVTADYVELPSDLTGGLTMQVSGSVRWEESIKRLLRDGVDTFVEIGSGDVLTGLMKRIEPSALALAVRDSETLDKTCAALSGAPPEQVQIAV